MHKSSDQNVVVLLFTGDYTTQPYGSFDPPMEGVEPVL